jgi:inosine-uridine nucleoside N-ribohydrolase
LEENGREKARFVHDIHSEILKTHRPAVCDPLACISVFSPENILSFYEAYGEVETLGKRTRGLLVFDWLRAE